MIETGQAIAEFEAGLALDTQSKVRKNRFVVHVFSENNCFTKTGSGQA
jgi:hypothetical protein